MLEREVRNKAAWDTKELRSGESAGGLDALSAKKELAFANCEASLDDTVFSLDTSTK